MTFGICFGIITDTFSMICSSFGNHDFQMFQNDPEWLGSCPYS